MNLLEKLIHKINILQEMADYREYKKAACISLARIGIKAVQQQIILLEAGDNYVLFRFIFYTFLLPIGSYAKVRKKFNSPKSSRVES